VLELYLKLKTKLFLLRFINWEDGEGNGRLQHGKRRRTASPVCLRIEKKAGWSFFQSI
jgi:hypothetical protein